MKEEITDMMTPAAYTAVDADGKHLFHKGKVLKFEYEGSITSIKLTRVDRKNQRMWGEHITLGDMDTAMTHYGHIIDTTQDPTWCSDCEVPVTDKATNKGDRRYKFRQEMKHGTSKQKNRSSKETGGTEEGTEGRRPSTAPELPKD